MRWRTCVLSFCGREQGQSVPPHGGGLAGRLRGFQGFWDELMGADGLSLDELRGLERGCVGGIAGGAHKHRLDLHFFTRREDRPLFARPISAVTRIVLYPGDGIYIARKDEIIKRLAGFWTVPSHTTWAADGGGTIRTSRQPSCL